MTILPSVDKQRNAELNSTVCLKERGPLVSRYSNAVVLENNIFGLDLVDHNITQFIMSEKR